MKNIKKMRKKISSLVESSVGMYPFEQFGTNLVNDDLKALANVRPIQAEAFSFLHSVVTLIDLLNSKKTKKSYLQPTYAIIP